jgi:hypothetical protein
VYGHEPDPSLPSTISGLIGIFAAGILSRLVFRNHAKPMNYRNSSLESNRSANCISFSNDRVLGDRMKVLGKKRTIIRNSLY